MLTHLIGSEPLPGVDFRKGTVDVGQTLGGEQVIQVLGLVLQVLLQDVSDIFVDARKKPISAARRRACW